ncbi:putative disease resistance protein RPP1, partial [Mucuna pruriens]
MAVNEIIRSIGIHLPTIKEQKLIPHVFAKMSKLQFQEISGEYNYDCFDQLHILAAAVQFLATEKFSAKKLIILKLRLGNMEKIRDGVKNLVSLKKLDLCYSNMLKGLPDLSKATNHEVLVLKVPDHTCKRFPYKQP